MRVLAIATFSIFAAACGTEQPAANQQSTTIAEPEPDQAAAATAANAALKTADGEARGTAAATQTGDGIALRIVAMGMAPGTYAAHVHTTGRCEGPAFESAGAHWNPTSRQHGRDNPQGMHKGDLPNLTVADNGTGTVDFTIASATINDGEAALLDDDGAAVVVHAKPDDYRTDPSGDAGDRIACGVLG